MTKLTKEQMLARVKDGLLITGNYQDAALEGYIDEVKHFLASAGVRAAVIDSDKAVGVITRGVSDLWNYGAAGGVLSPYFYQRTLQLAYEPMDATEVSD